MVIQLDTMGASLKLETRLKVVHLRYSLTFWITYTETFHMLLILNGEVQTVISMALLMFEEP